MSKKKLALLIALGVIVVVAAVLGVLYATGVFDGYFVVY